MPSSNRSSSVPFSFDRFRVRSIQFRSSSRNRQCEKCTKPSPERSRIRKSQVRPTNIKTSESKRIGHDSTYLFHVNQRSSLLTCVSTENSENQTSSNNFFNTQRASNVARVFDYSQSSSAKSSDSTTECPPTPCMLRYREDSIQNKIPTRIIKRPISLDGSSKQVDLDDIDQINI